MMEQQTLPGFKRGRQVGFNILGFKTEGQSIFVRVLEMGVHLKKDGDEIEYATVINLATGEEQRMWLDGALKHNFAKKESAQGLPFAVEIRYDGKKEAEVMIKGKAQPTMINTYTMWDLDEETEATSN